MSERMTDEELAEIERVWKSRVGWTCEIQTGSGDQDYGDRLAVRLANGEWWDQLADNETAAAIGAAPTHIAALVAEVKQLRERESRETATTLGQVLTIGAPYSFASVPTWTRDEAIEKLGYDPLDGLPEGPPSALVSKLPGADEKTERQLSDLELKMLREYIELPEAVHPRTLPRLRMVFAELSRSRASQRFALAVAQAQESRAEALAAEAERLRAMVAQMEASAVHSPLDTLTRELPRVLGEMGYGPGLQWTREKPTVDGEYWLRDAQEPALIVRLRRGWMKHGLWHAVGHDSYVVFEAAEIPDGYEWAGPLVPPGDEP